MSALAAIRPDDFNLALFVHVIAALVTFGALALAVGYLVAARRGGSLAATRVGFRSLLYGALPAFIVMRVGAQWIADEEGLADANLAWIDIGYGISDAGGLLVIVSTVAAGLALRRANRGEPGGPGTAVATWLCGLMLVAYVVAIWAMTTKPV